MAFEDVARHQSSTKVLLAEVSAGQVHTAWTQHGVSTNCWSSVTTYKVTAVQEAGSDLTSRADLATCNSNDESFFWDAANELVYVNPAASDPHDVTIIATVQLNFSNVPKVIESVPYFSRVLDAPAVSLRVPERFDGMGQVGGGVLNLANEDGESDVIRDLQLDGRSEVLRM